MLHIWFRGKLPWRKKRTEDDEMDEDGKLEEEWRCRDNPVLCEGCGDG